MCRYAMYGPYKPKYACFRCRKSYKQSVMAERADAMSLPMSEAERCEWWRTRVVWCPQCRGEMTNMGLDFKAPAQNDVKQWRKVELLVQNGYRFSSCGCGGPGPRPARLQDVAAFLKEQQDNAERFEHRQRAQEQELKWKNARRAKASALSKPKRRTTQTT